MKLKKNDLLELKKGGLPSVETKLKELRLELSKWQLELARGQAKNASAGRLLRRSIAQLMTIKRDL